MLQGMKRVKITGLLLMFGILFNGSPAYSQTTLGARAVALGQATSALPNCSWSVFENVAMINEDRAHASFFAMRYYGLSALTDIAAVITYPTRFGIVGGGGHRFGNHLFNKSRIRLIYENSYQHFHFGAALNYSHAMEGGGYGSYGAIGIDIGIAALLTKDLWIGAKATNINQPAYGRTESYREDLPRNLSVGISYQLSGVALFTTDVVKDVDFPLSYRAGIEVKIIENLKARAGITTAPQTFSAGFGYNTRTVGADIVVQKHSEGALGYSPGIDFNVAW
jgi:hypothetical protein